MILTSQIATQLDVLMAGHLLALASLALYDFSKNLMSIADMPARVLNVSSFATIRKLMVGGEMEKVREVYNKATFFQFAIGLAVATLILLNLDFLVSKLPPRGYDMVYPILTVLLVAKLFDLLTGMNWAIISVSEHYNFNLMISIATLAIALPAQYILTQNFGIQGVAMGFLVSIVVMNVFRSFVVYRKFSILPWSRYWLYLGVLLTMAVGVLLGYTFLGGNGIILSVLFVLAFGGYSYFLFNRGLIKV
jgi:O-antigen/teichoic acid export membrane protein